MYRAVRTQESPNSRGAVAPKHPIHIHNPLIISYLYTSDWFSMGLLFFSLFAAKLDIFQPRDPGLNDLKTFKNS